MRLLSDEQRARLAAAPPGDRDQLLPEIRRQHVRRSLADAVTEGRLTQARATRCWIGSSMARMSTGYDANSAGPVSCPGQAERADR
jgi:hypothetical protein